MKEIIHSDKGPKAIGPYSQAIRAGRYVFTSGQVGVDPETGKLVEGGIQGQTAQVMKNLQTILGEAGLTLANVVKSTVFLSDMGHFPEFNATYGSFFEKDPPARSTFQVAALPLGALVEIEMIAFTG